MSWKNTLSIHVLKALKPLLYSRFTKKSSINKYLIVSTTALGDSLWATPAIRSLKCADPLSQIFIFTSSIGREVFENNPHIDKILLYKNTKFFYLLAAYFRLNRHLFKAIFIFHTSDRIILPLCYLLNSKQIIGTQGINKGLDSLLTKILPQKHQHEILRRLEIVASVVPIQNSYPMEFYLDEQSRSKAKIILSSFNINNSKLKIGFHPGATDAFKRWPASNFIKLGNRLKQLLDCDIILTGGIREKDLVQEIADQIPESKYIKEPIDLKTLGSLIKSLDLFICNDTGPMHLAFALGTATISLFTPTQPELCGPLHVLNSRWIKKDITCSPCIKKKCNNPFCMKQITPEEVEVNAIELLERKK
ncbi:MAG: glycosyltransferase family 9 protein [Chlamydiae bacterium]|nr:glycosyltransferase family 9 protein [Chlamydiota bacterium]